MIRKGVVTIYYGGEGTVHPSVFQIEGLQSVGGGCFRQPGGSLSRLLEMQCGERRRLVAATLSDEVVVRGGTSRVSRPEAREQQAQMEEATVGEISQVAKAPTETGEIGGLCGCAWRSRCGCRAV